MLSNASLSNLRPYTEDKSETYSHSVSENQVLGKRLFDIIFSFLTVLFLLVWLIPLLGIAIRLSSPGPILFVQLRTGRNGRPFRCYKLRTMHCIQEKETAYRQATQNDPRVYKLGQLLRKTNLDELPQFINVLMGDMSIVGPRPHPIQLDAQYWQALPNYAQRYQVKPGVTGLAQVRGHRGETNTTQKMQHRVRLDHWYIAKRSFGLDLKICWWTVTNMVKGDKKAW